MDVLVYDFGANGTGKGYFFSSFLPGWDSGRLELLLSGALILWTATIVIGPTGFLKVGTMFWDHG